MATAIKQNRSRLQRAAMPNDDANTARHQLRLTAVLCLLMLLVVQTSSAQAEQPWDFDPYKVLIWLIADDAHSPDMQQLSRRVVSQLDTTFKATWQTTLEPAPEIVVPGLRRNLQNVSYEQLVAADLVLAVSRTFEEASSVRSVELALQKVDRLISTPAAAERLAASEDEAVRKLAEKLVTDFQNPSEILAAFNAGETDAAIFQRGLLQTLPKEPRTVPLAAPGQIQGRMRGFDKLIVLRLQTRREPFIASAVELDLFMQRVGPVVSREAYTASELADAATRAITRAFGPVARIENAGASTAELRLRAGGLIQDPNSPALIGVGDYVLPMLRRNDRSGALAHLQVIDWTYLHITEREGSKLDAKVHFARVGGLQGRSNRRTYKWAFKVRPFDDATTLRLHAKGDPDDPLIGYEVYEKDLQSGDMQLVGRTNWDGRLPIEKTDEPMRLLYVKNGDSVLARLPMVPGETPLETANLVGDDTRLEAEAYLKSVENMIVDLIAVRTMLAARIRYKLGKGDLEGAEQLLQALREQPTYKIIADDMQREATVIRSDNRGEQQKIDNMFAATRQLLVNNITPKLVRDLEQEVLAAKNGETSAPDESAAE